MKRNNVIKQSNQNRKNFKKRIQVEYKIGYILNIHYKI